MADSVSSALLLVLESLSPLERAVFVLHEAFGFSYTEVARMIGSSDAAVRQTARRARRHVEAHRPSYDTDARTREEATAAFLAATTGGDLEALMRILAPDVTLVADGGGLARAPRKAILGLENVAKSLVLFASRTGPQDVARLVHVNGGPGIVVYSGGAPTAALTLHLVDGLVGTIHLVSNPEKLTGLVAGEQAAG
jgi:hypothetical protein